MCMYYKTANKGKKSSNGNIHAYFTAHRCIKGNKPELINIQTRKVNSDLC